MKKLVFDKERDDFDIRLTSPRHKGYIVTPQTISASYYKFAVGGFWRCHTNIRYSSNKLIIDHAHSDSIDEVYFYEDRVDGVYKREDGKQFKFDGNFKGKDDVELNIRNKDGQSETCYFIVKR